MQKSRSGFQKVDSPDPPRCQVLLEIIDSIAKARSLLDALTRISPSVFALTGGEFLNVAFHDSRRDILTMQYWKKDGESGEVESFPVLDTASGWAWKNQEPLVIADVEREARFPETASLLSRHGIRSYAALPMSTVSGHFGVLALGSIESLNAENVDLMARIATMGALALERERAGRIFEEQQSLVAISRELGSTLESEKLLPAILSSMRSIARYERSDLALLDEDGNNVQLYGDALGWGSVNQGTMAPVKRSLSGKAIESRGVEYFTEGDLRRIDAPLAQAMLDAGIRSVCSAPLIAGERIWGALNISSTTKNAYGPSEAEYLEQVASLIGTALCNAHSYHQIAKLKDRLAQEKRYLENEICSATRSDDLVGDSPALQRVLDFAAVVADTDSTVLITGETGTGKERIARLIHSMSGREESNFIKVNCAAIPNGLLESELFGHEKGAFTGAVSQKIGRLELADNGTLLLDEIGEIPLELQPKLLRVLQDQEFERLGGTRTIRVNIRLIAATNRDLAQAVEDKEFRGDLFYRLHVFPLHLPALRDRREDIPKLIRYFVEKCSQRLHKHIDIIPDEAIEAMVNWRWPGNIRELENFIERSVILSEGSRLAPPLGELRGQHTRQIADSEGTLRDKEREHIVEILRQTRGTLSGPSGAAARLGLKRTTLQYKMQRLGISRMDYLS